MQVGFTLAGPPCRPYIYI